MDDVITDINTRDSISSGLSEPNIRDLFNAMHLVVVHLDATGKVIYINPYVSQITGFSQGEVIGKSWFDIFIPEDIRNLVISEFQRLNSMTSVFHQFENAICTKSKAQRIVSWNNAILKDQKGDFAGTISIGEDVTDQKQTFDLLNIQKDLAVSLNTKLGIREACSKMLDIICTIKSVDCGGVYLVNEMGELTLISAKGFTEGFISAISKYSADSPNTQLVMLGHPVYKPYSEIVSQMDDVRVNEGLKALIVLPIKQGDDVVACLNLASHKFDLTPPEVRIMLEAVSAQLADFIVRINTEEKLGRSEEYYRSLINDSLDMIAVLDTQGVITYESESTTRILGYEINEQVGRKSFDFIHPDDISAIVEVFKNGIQHLNTPYRVQYRYLHHDGSWRILESIGKAVTDNSKIRIIVNSRDVTDQKKAEQDLITRNIELEKLNKIMVGREVRMAEMKKEIEELKKK